MSLKKKFYIFLDSSFQTETTEDVYMWPTLISVCLPVCVPQVEH